jgi:hypothetical protein
VTLQTCDWSELSATASTSLVSYGGKHIDHYFCRWQAKIVTINIFFEKNEKNEKCLKLPDLARKLIRKAF